MRSYNSCNSSIPTLGSRYARQSIYQAMQMYCRSLNCELHGPAHVSGVWSVLKAGLRLTDPNLLKGRKFTVFGIYIPGIYVLNFCTRVL